MRSLVATLTVVLTSCSTTPGTPVPPDIAYGRDICRQCGMIITEARFAAAYSFEGDSRIFDDIGDMIVYGIRTGELTPDTPAWVHDYHSGEWIDADTAWFVRSAGLVTPMDHDLVAFATRETAVAVAGFEGVLLAWDNLLAVTVRDTVLDFD